MEHAYDKSKSTKSDMDLLDKVKKQWEYTLDHPVWVEARKKMLQCHDYKEGNQWTEDEKAELKERHQPDTVNNLVAPAVNKLVGELVSQRVRIGFRGRNGKDDEQLATILTDLFLHIRQTNDLEFQERDMAEDGFTGGFGCMDVWAEFDDMYQPEIKVRSEDSALVFPDPDAKRYDWNEDARFIHSAKWIGEELAREKYPHAKKAIDALLSGSSMSDEVGGQLANIDAFRGDTFLDEKQRQIRVIETQYKKYEREVIYLTGEGGIYREDDFNAEVKKELDDASIAFEKLVRMKTKICVVTWGAGMIIENKVTDRKYYSKVPYFAYRKKNGAPYSLFTLALSMQDAVNKRDSKALHLLNSNKIYGEVGVLDDPTKIAQENARPDGVVVLADGALQNGRVQFQNNTELSAGQHGMYQSSIQSFYSIIGINPNTFETTGQIRSGSGLQQKFAEANKPISSLFDNLKRSRKILGRVLLDFIQTTYTREKVFMVTDSEDAAGREVVVSAETLKKIKSSIYDVTVDDFEDSANLQTEQFKLFLQYLPTLLPFGNFWTKKALEMSDLRNKDAILKELDAMGGPPPITPRVSVQANINELLPVERAVFYKMMGQDDVAAAVLAARPPTSTEVKGTVELSKTALQSGARRQTDREKNDKEAI